MESLNWYNSSQGADIKTPSKNTLTFTTNPKTDIWRTPREHRKNAHFYYQEVSGDFLVSIKFKGDYKEQYDQAGLMLRVSDDKWLKSGIELINNVPHVRISAVVTNPYSDWSIAPLKEFTKDNYLYLRIERKGSKIIIDYFIPPTNFTEPEDVNKLDWTFLRKITFFSDASNTQVGISAATPQGDQGFEVTFENYKLD